VFTDVPMDSYGLRERMKKTLLQILIADIDELLADTLSSIVREALGEKYEVKFVFNPHGDQLLKLAESGKFDIYILTLNNIVFRSQNLPPERRLKKSLDLVANLKTQHGKPIITLSGSIDNVDLGKKAMRAGADFYFQLPVGADAFENAIHECLTLVPAIETKKDVLHPVYLPFTEDQLKSHFVDVKTGGECVDTVDRHVQYFKRSIQKYEEYLSKNPDRTRKPISELRGPCQIEKDERFWVASSLMTVFYSRKRTSQCIELLKRAYGEIPPTKDSTSWEDCVNGKLHLFFECNLPSPVIYKEWLCENQRDRHIIPYVHDSAVEKKSLEGPTNVDALLLNSTTGFAVVMEAKVLSDISHDITYDVMRNQIARNVDVMLEPNGNLCDPLNGRDPDKTLFLLVTPRIFRDNPASRLYGYKMNEYKSDPKSLRKDLQHREGVDWTALTRRIGWLTWEEFREVNGNCCAWLGN
jgi:DNA-binding NarL/FixJ family response regulator